MKISKIKELKRNKQRLALEKLGEVLTLVRRIKMLDDIIYQKQLEKIVSKNNKYVRITNKRIKGDEINFEC